MLLHHAAGHGLSQSLRGVQLMKKLLLFLLLLSGCTTNSPDNSKAVTQTYTPQVVDAKYPIRILYVNSVIIAPTTSNNNSPISRWGIGLVNTSDSDFAPYNWRIRSTNGREFIFSNDRILVPARGIIYFAPEEPNFLDTANGFVSLVSSDGKEVQTVSWQVYKTSIYGFPKPQNTPFVLESVLPNPEGTEAENEAIVIHNISDTTVFGKDWKIRNTSGKQEQLFPNVAYSSNMLLEIKYKIPAWLNNNADTIQIVNPERKVVHSIGWQNAKKGQRIYAQP